MVFVLHFLVVISYLLEGAITYLNVYTKQELIVWKSMKCFEDTKFDFFYSSGKYFICFLF